MVVKEHSPLDSLRERLAGFLRAIADAVSPEPNRVSALLDRASPDDEPVTTEDEKAIENGCQDYRAREARSLDDVKRELG